VPPFQRTLSLDPKYDDAEIYLGWSYVHLGRYLDATHHFRQVTERQPRWEGAWNGLAWSLCRAREYQRALRLDPDYADARAGLAEASR